METWSSRDGSVARRGIPRRGHARRFRDVSAGALAGSGRLRRSGRMRGTSLSTQSTKYAVREPSVRPVSGIPVAGTRSTRTLVISQRALKSRLGKPDTQLALIRAAHRTLDPEKIGDLIVEHALRVVRRQGRRGSAVTTDGVLEQLAGRGHDEAARRGRAEVSQLGRALRARICERESAPRRAGRGRRGSACWRFRCSAADTTIGALVLLDRSAHGRPRRAVAAGGRAADGDAGRPGRGARQRADAAPRRRRCRSPTT